MLFEDIEDLPKGPNKKQGIMDEEIANLPLGMVKFNEDKLKSLLIQLLTCSLIVPREDKIDIKKWASNIPELYKRRFKSMKVFKEWADTYCEFLTWNAEDEELESLGYSDVEIQAIVAYDLIEELERFPQNECITVYIEQLEKYIYL